MKRVKLYFKNILLVLDGLGAVLIGGFPGETVSGRCGRARIHGLRIGGFFADVIDAVFLFCFNDKDHCAHAVERDAKGRHEEAVSVE